MKLIDLLNKIANGEKIKAFKFDEYIFKYDGDRENWKNENGDILSTYCNVEECLNDKVEIIEEEKKAPTLNDIRESYGLARIEEKKIPEKIEYYDDSIAWVIDGIGQLSDVDKVIVDKLNEVLDYLKSKGDE